MSTSNDIKLEPGAILDNNGIITTNTSSNPVYIGKDSWGPNITISNSSSTTFSFPATYESHVGPYLANCSACNKEKNIVYEYGSSSIKRVICEFCYIAWMDKRFMIQSDSETLETLFKKE